MLHGSWECQNNFHALSKCFLLGAVAARSTFTSTVCCIQFFLFHHRFGNLGKFGSFWKCRISEPRFPRNAQKPRGCTAEFMKTWEQWVGTFILPRPFRLLLCVCFVFAKYKKKHYMVLVVKGLSFFLFMFFVIYNCGYLQGILVFCKRAITCFTLFLVFFLRCSWGCICWRRVLPWSMGGVFWDGIGVLGIEIGIGSGRMRTDSWRRGRQIFGECSRWKGKKVGWGLFCMSLLYKTHPMRKQGENSSRI